MLWTTKNRVILPATIPGFEKVCRVQLATNIKSERAFLKALTFKNFLKTAQFDN